MSATVIGDYTVGPATASSLLTGIVAFWKLEEASGTRVDEVGNNDLSDNNTVTQAAGKIGNAAQFTAANNESLSITDNTDLSTGDIDFTISAWVYLDSLTITYPGIVAKGGTGVRDFNLIHRNDTNRFTFQVESDGADGSPITVDANNFGNASTSTWYLIIVWHDSVNNTINICVNNGTPDSTPHTTGVFDGNTPFYIGFLPNGGGYYWNGRIDAVGFWKRVLTADERTALYNSGSGVEYPFS